VPSPLLALFAGGVGVLTLVPPGPVRQPPRSARDLTGNPGSPIPGPWSLSLLPVPFLCVLCGQLAISVFHAFLPRNRPKRNPRL
jgi:hypothetical protein